MSTDHVLCSNKHILQRWISAAYFLHLHFKVYYSTLSFTRRLAFPLPYQVLLSPQNPSVSGLRVSY